MQDVAEADKFGAALDAVRRAIRDQAVAPGEALLVDSLARRLRMSATPIREALAYLSGVGVAERQGRGYRVKRLDPSDVTELYELHSAYVRMALDRMTPQRRGQATLGTQTQPLMEQTYRDRVEGFWHGIAAMAGNHRLQRALQRLTDQLALVRMAEPRVFADTDPELTDLLRRSEADDGEAFRVAVEAYHQRRAASATALSAAIHWPRSTGKI